jgi:hypothetical protein
MRKALESLGGLLVSCAVALACSGGSAPTNAVVGGGGASTAWQPDGGKTSASSGAGGASTTSGATGGTAPLSGGASAGGHVTAAGSDSGGHVASSGSGGSGSGGGLWSSAGAAGDSAVDGGAGGDTSDTSGAAGQAGEPSFPLDKCGGCAEGEICVRGSNDKLFCYEIGHAGSCDPEHKPTGSPCDGYCETQKPGCRTPYFSCSWMFADDGTDCPVCSALGSYWNCGPE